MSWPWDLRCAPPNFMTCSTQNVTVCRLFIGRLFKMADALATVERYVALCNTSLIAETSSAAVKWLMSRLTPNPRRAIRTAFWGCSANIGKATIGTPWYTASFSPPLPQWVINRTVRACPMTSFCGSHGNKCTFLVNSCDRVMLPSFVNLNNTVCGNWLKASKNLLNIAVGTLNWTAPSDMTMTPWSVAVLTIFSMCAGRGRAGLALREVTWIVLGSDG